MGSHVTWQQRVAAWEWGNCGSMFTVDDIIQSSGLVRAHMHWKRMDIYRSGGLTREHPTSHSPEV